MSKVITLRGIAWDHPRGYEPLRATSKEFAKLHPEVQINWDIRSLKEFGDMPIEDLIDSYDLITIDHPYMGQAYANKLLLALEKRISKENLKALERQSVGPSFQSYLFKDHLFALPIDAAALVAASRKDILTRLKLSLPITRVALLEFYKKIPSDYTVAWPLCATDVWCTFLTLCAQDTGGNFIHEDIIDNKVGSDVLDELKEHLECLHPESINWNPIQVLDRMAENDHIIYAPFLFGYTNYSRAGYAKNRVSFSNSPTNPKHEVSTILGGVGLSVSAKCKYPDLAAAYVHFVAQAEIQETIYTENGGQPAHLTAWKSAANNRLCNDFFDDTRTTMERVYMRPRHVRWNEFQELGAELLHNGLVNDSPSAAIMKDLNRLYQSIV